VRDNPKETSRVVGIDALVRRAQGKRRCSTPT